MKRLKKIVGLFISIFTSPIYVYIVVVASLSISLCYVNSGDTLEGICALGVAVVLLLCGILDAQYEDEEENATQIVTINIHNPLDGGDIGVASEAIIDAINKAATKEVIK